MEGPLALIGYMGSGKSTVGRIVARELDWEFIDLDEVLAKKAGVSIEKVFEDSGEPYFRNLERRTLNEVLGENPQRVVACGGGVVVEPANRARLLEVFTVFLWENTEVLYRRTRGPGRPLRGTSYEDFARRYAERLPYYLEVAGLHIETGERPPREIAAEILRWLRG